MQDTVWGKRWIVRRDDTHETSILYVNANHRCSWHHHEHKHNRFACISGLVAVVTQSGGGKAGNVTLKAGDMYDVPAGVKHEFRALEDSVVVEEMFVVYAPEDIVRAHVGGIFGG